MHGYVKEEKKGNVDIVIYNLYCSLKPSPPTKLKPHDSKKLSDAAKAPSRLWAPMFSRRPAKRQDYLLQVVLSTTTNALPEPLENFYTRPLGTEPCWGAGKSRHHTLAPQVCPSPKPTLLLRLSQPHGSGSPRPCGTSRQEPLKLRWQSWQATCDVTESGVTMASDLLMFIGNE